MNVRTITVLGAGTMAPLIRRLLPDAEIVTRERFSRLTYSGPKKLTRLPRRSDSTVRVPVGARDYATLALTFWSARTPDTRVASASYVRAISSRNAAGNSPGFRCATT